MHLLESVESCKLDKGFLSQVTFIYTVYKQCINSALYNTDCVCIVQEKHVLIMHEDNRKVN